MWTVISERLCILETILKGTKCLFQVTLLFSNFALSFNSDRLNRTNRPMWTITACQGLSLTATVYFGAIC